MYILGSFAPSKRCHGKLSHSAYTLCHSACQKVSSQQNSPTAFHRQPSAFAFVSGTHDFPSVALLAPVTCNKGELWLVSMTNGHSGPCPGNDNCSILLSPCEEQPSNRKVQICGRVQGYPVVQVDTLNSALLTRVIFVSDL